MERINGIVPEHQLFALPLYPVHRTGSATPRRDTGYTTYTGVVQHITQHGLSLTPAGASPGIRRCRTGPRTASDLRPGMFATAVAGLFFCRSIALGIPRPARIRNTIKRSDCVNYACRWCADSACSDTFRTLTTACSCTRSSQPRAPGNWSGCTSS